MLLRCTASREGKLNTFLRRELSMSSSLVSRLKCQNALLVNGAPAHTGHLVRTGDEVAVRLEETVEGFSPEEMPLSILLRGRGAHRAGQARRASDAPLPCRNDGTLANGLLAYYQKTGQRCGIHPVSRLDRDTFGVVLLAKNAYVHEKIPPAPSERRHPQDLPRLRLRCAGRGLRHDRPARIQARRRQPPAHRRCARPAGRHRIFPFSGAGNAPPFWRCIPSPAARTSCGCTVLPPAGPSSATRSTQPTPPAPIPRSAALRRSSSAPQSWRSRIRSPASPSVFFRIKTCSARRRRTAVFEAFFRRRRGVVAPPLFLLLPFLPQYFPCFRDFP